MLVRHVQLFVTPWSVARQAPPFMGFSRQEYWSGLPFPSPGDLSKPREGTQVSHTAGRLFTIWVTREALFLRVQFRWNVFSYCSWGSEYSLERLMLKLKLQNFAHLMQRAGSLEKDSDAGKDWRQEEKGITEDEMARWHHWLYAYESEQAPGVGDAQGSLACCSPWDCKQLNKTEGLN